MPDRRRWPAAPIRLSRIRRGFWICMSRLSKMKGFSALSEIIVRNGFLRMASTVTSGGLRLWIILVICFGFAQTGQTASKEEIEGAKREGEVVLYASMNLSEANAMIGRFEERYPFVKVKLNRTGSEKLL